MEYKINVTDKGKFHSFEYLDHVVVPEKSPEQEFSIDLAVVWTVWADPKYFYALIYSLKSFYSGTDLNKCRVFILVDDRYMDLLKELLGSMYVNIQVEGVSHAKYYWPNDSKIRHTCIELLNKYTALNNTKLKNYSKVVLVDTDCFYVGRSRNLFKDIYNSSVISAMIHDIDGADYIFSDRLATLGTRFHDTHEFLLWSSNRLNVPLSKMYEFYHQRFWGLSGFSVFSRSVYNSEDFSNYCAQCSTNELYCDETVINSYLWSRGILADNLLTTYGLGDIRSEIIDVPVEVMDKHTSQILQVMTGSSSNPNHKWLLSFYKYIDNKYSLWAK